MNCNFYSDISTAGTSTAITFSGGAGRVTVAGSAPQAFNGAAAQKPIVRRLTMSTSNADLTLNVPVDISSLNTTGDLTMTTGNIITTASNILTLADETVTSTIGNSSSYVSGPMAYVDNNNGTAQTLNFPIGKGGKWRPVILNVTHNNTTAYTYTPEMFNISAMSLGYTLPGTLNIVSYVRYWQIDRTPSNSANLTAASATLYYDTDDGVNDPANLVVAKTIGAGTAWTDVGGPGSASPTGSVTSSVNFTTFSKFTLGNKNGGTNPLPVEFLSFDVVPDGNDVNTTWETATEMNSDYFMLQRSQDGIVFEDVQKVSAAGNSTTIKKYSAVDRDPFSEISYYRLKQFDKNGNFFFSQIIAVNMNSGKGISVYPNPALGAFNINISEQKGKEVLLVIRDCNGKEFYSKVVIVANEQEIVAVDPAQKIPAGIYLITATADNSIYEKKIVIR